MDCAVETVAGERGRGERERWGEWGERRDREMGREEGMVREEWRERRKDEGKESGKKGWREGGRLLCCSPELTRPSGAEARSWTMNLKNAYTAFESWSSCI